MAERLDLAVIESRWWNRSNDSVRGVFDLLAGSLMDNPFAYHYEMFNNKASIQEIIPRLARQPDIHHIYIGAHGNERAIFGSGKQRIPWSTIQNLLEEIESKQLHGLFFGCCKFGEQVERLIAKSAVTWIAGYTEAVDWVHSSAMDLYFWNAYYQSSVPDETRKDDRARAMVALLTALYIRVPYMFVELGFRVALRNRGNCRTFPDDFFREDGEPYDAYSELFNEVGEFISESQPGSWPFESN